MKKVLFFSITAVAIVLLLMPIIAHISVGSKDYAIDYARVFGSYDIELVDKYLDAESLIIYKDKIKTYKELRPNVIAAFHEKKYFMTKGYSYGDGQTKGDAPIIKIQSYVEYHGETVENLVVMQLERIGWKDYRVQAVCCDDDFFGYLFFDIE